MQSSWHDLALVMAFKRTTDTSSLTHEQVSVYCFPEVLQATVFISKDHRLIPSSSGSGSWCSLYKMCSLTCSATHEGTTETRVCWLSVNGHWLLLKIRSFVLQDGSHIFEETKYTHIVLLCVCERINYSSRHITLAPLS